MTDTQKPTVMAQYCNELDPRVAVRLNRNGKVVRGIPRCKRPPNHGRCHKGEGWIWDEVSSKTPGLDLNQGF